LPFPLGFKKTERWTQIGSCHPKARYQDVEREGREPLRSAQHVRDLHLVIVDERGKVVHRHSIRLEQDEVVDRAVLDSDRAPHEIQGCRAAFLGDLETDNMRLARRRPGFGLLAREVPAQAVIVGRLAALQLCLANLGQPLDGTEAVVGVIRAHQFLSPFMVEL